MKSTPCNGDRRNPRDTRDLDFGSDLQADPEIAKHFKKGELEAPCSLDWHFKEGKNRLPPSSVLHSGTAPPMMISIPPMPTCSALTSWTSWRGKFIRVACVLLQRTVTASTRVCRVCHPFRCGTEGTIVRTDAGPQAGRCSACFRVVAPHRATQGRGRTRDRLAAQGRRRARSESLPAGLRSKLACGFVRHQR